LQEGQKISIVAPLEPEQRRTMSRHMLYPNTVASLHTTLPLNACSCMGLHHICPRTSRSPNASDGSEFFPNFGHFKNHILEMIIQKLYFQF
jgi:hypothetical protein